MNGPRGTCWRVPLRTPLVAVALAIGAWTSAPAPVSAQLYYGFGPRYYAPGPYYYPPPPPAAAPEPTAAPAITYTKRKAFKNADGQTCREYKTNVGGNARYGTACRDADGQWRIAN